MSQLLATSSREPRTYSRSLAGLSSSSVHGISVRRLRSLAGFAVNSPDSIPQHAAIQLTIQPIVAAITAGNTVVVKPSDVSPHCSALLQDLIARYLDTEAVHVIQGGAEETTLLLRERFDHIFYTGNGTVGRIIMKAAAEHLTPVTLELGGKSPVFVDKDANLDLAAHRIAWGRCVNTGQICVAPEYVLVHRDVKAALIAKLKGVYREYWGPDPKASPDFGRIINSRHFDRISGLLASCGGTVDTGGSAPVADELFIPPTLVVEPDPSSRFMNEEVFGPVQAIIGVSGVNEAIAFINARPRPLAVYVFSASSATQERIVMETSSGGVTINDTVVHAMSTQLPFGGIGASGMGSYHGPFGFETLSHAKIRNPPYNPAKSKLFEFILTSIPDLPSVSWKDVAILVLAAGVAVLGAKVGHAF